VTVPHTADRCTALPDDQAIDAAVTALEEHGFSAEVAAGPGAAQGQHSYVGRVLEVRQELPGRSHIVLVRQQAASE
jgi:hypothetical protein